MLLPDDWTTNTVHTYYSLHWRELCFSSRCGTNGGVGGGVTRERSAVEKSWLYTRALYIYPAVVGFYGGEVNVFFKSAVKGKRGD